MVVIQNTKIPKLIGPIKCIYLSMAYTINHRPTKVNRIQKLYVDVTTYIVMK